MSRLARARGKLKEFLSTRTVRKYDMNCEEAIKLVGGFLDGELDALTSEQVELHLPAVRLDWDKDTKWVLFDPNELQRFARRKGGFMKNGEEKS